MAMRLGMLKAAAPGSKVFTSVLRRWAHGAAIPPPLDGSLHSEVASPPLVLPEFDSSPDGDRTKDFELGPPGFFSGGSMELMAVPKKKVSKHKRGIRNGPKALKPTPVIIRCRSCGRVKLPHFFCCSGERGIPGEQNS